MRTTYKTQTVAEINAQKNKKFDFNKPTSGKVKRNMHKIVKVTNMSKVSDDTCQWDFKSVE